MEYVKTLESKVSKRISTNQMTTDNQGNIIIAEMDSCILQVFNPDGIFLRTIDLSGKSHKFRSFRGVGVNSSDQIIATTGEELMTIDSSGNFVGFLAKNLPSDGISFTKNIQINSRDEIITSFNEKILTLNRDGQKVSQFDPGLDDLEFRFHGFRMSVNSQDNIIVSDTDEKSLKVFDEKGQLITILANSHSGLLNPTAVTINHKDEIFLLDIGPSSCLRTYIKIFSPDGKMTYNSKKDCPGGFFMSYGIKVNSTDIIVNSDGKIEMFLDTRYFY